uniref:Uncharacterized protein n=1 Tax=Anser brachyrhynchus TaxID=132585 RepID=A0A8B9C3B9_9AVES
MTYEVLQHLQTMAAIPWWCKPQRGYRSHWCCASWCCASWCCASWCCVPWCCVSWCCVPWCCVSQRCCCVSRCSEMWGWRLQPLCPKNGAKKGQNPPA